MRKISDPFVLPLPLLCQRNLTDPSEISSPVCLMLRMSYTHRSVCSLASELDESCEKEEEIDRENRGLGMGGK